MGFQSPENLLHFLLVPLMSQSHLIPFTDMARQLSDRGPLVTILLTPLNAVRFNSVLADGVRIQVLVIPLPYEAAGLPKGIENIDSLPSPDLVMNFFEASNLMRDPLEDWIDRVEPKPNCIVSDICFPWTADVSRRFNIPRLIFHGISCFTMFCSSNIKKHNILETLTSDTDRFVVPDMPDTVEFTRGQLPETQMLDMGEDKEDLMDQFKAAELSADGVMVNSFEELEPNYVKGYRTVVKNLWCVGPVSLSESTKSDRGNKSAIDEDCCLKWLDNRSPRSVLYVCFGSLCHLQGRQLVELAVGLESSKCSFVWVIRKGDYSEELDKWFLEQKYEERVKDRSLIVRGWAPQVLILSHSSIMGFMTHCGWNSTLEGVAAGVPLITWPMFAEQFYNEKLIVHVIKTGVPVGAVKCIKWGGKEEEEGEVEILVKRYDVERAIEKLMDEGEEGRERRRRATRLRVMAKAAVEEGGSSYLNMSLMIQHVKNILEKNILGGVC